MVLFYEDLCAWVSIDGQTRHVYGVNASRNLITCWIASEAGKKFSVNWRNVSRTFSLQGIVYIDGVACDTHIMLDAKSFPDRPNAIGVCYARTSEYTRRDFMFTPIHVTDDDTFLDTIDRAHDFGTIKLELWVLQVSSVASKPQEHQPGNPVLESQVVHERSKKAGTHHVKYGEEYYSPPPTVDVVTGRVFDKLPYATFVFKYRPMALLMADGIVPRPAPPFDQSTAARIRALETKIANLRSQAGTQSVIKNTTSTRAEGSRQVKTEPGVIEGSIRKRSPVKSSLSSIIDLTKD